MFVKQYLEYVRDNPQGYWFKAKIYGWGWVPARWQGWLVIAVYVAALIAFAGTIDENSSLREVMFTFVLPGTFLTLHLLSHWREAALAMGLS